MEDEDEPLIVIEEPPEGEDTTSAYGAESSSPMRKVTNEGTSKNRGFSSIVTAIRVAKWMAKAYGFTSKQKSLYIPQDQVSNIQKKE